MQHAAWKLAALAGVVGIGLLVVVQAQRGLKPAVPVASTEQPPLEVSLGPEQELAPADDTSIPAQSEPQAALEDDNGAVPAAVKTRGSRDAAPSRGRPIAAADPFADPVDSDRAEPEPTRPRRPAGQGLGRGQPGPARAARIETAAAEVSADDLVSPDQARVAPAAATQPAERGPALTAEPMTTEPPADAESLPGEIPPLVMNSSDDFESTTIVNNRTPDRPAMKPLVLRAAPDPLELSADEPPAGAAVEELSSPGGSRKKSGGRVLVERPRNPRKKLPVLSMGSDPTDVGDAPADDASPTSAPRARAEISRPLADDSKKVARGLGLQNEAPARGPKLPVMLDGDDAGRDADRGGPEILRTTGPELEPTETTPAAATAVDDDLERVTPPGKSAMPRAPVDEEPPATQTPADQAPGELEPAAPARRPVADEPPGAAPESPAEPVQKPETEDFPPGTPRLGSAPSVTVPAKPLATAPEPSPPPTSLQPIEPVEADPPSAPPTTQKPQLTIDKVAPESAVIGQPVIYYITVRNVGATPAAQVVVEDRVPQGVQLRGTIPQAHWDGVHLIWKLGTLEPGAEKKIAVRVIPQSEGVIESVATVNFSADVGSRTLVTAPRIRLEIGVPEQATVGAPVVFNFKVSNVGSTPATHVTIRDVLPAGLRHPDGEDDLEYEVGTLPPGKSKDVQLTLTAAQAGRIVNRAVALADGGVSVQTESSLEVLPPQLVLARTGPRRLFLNKSGQYATTITNGGATPITPINVVETVPAGMAFVSASHDGRYDPARRTITWKITRLDPRQSQTVSTTLTLESLGAKVCVVRASDGAGASGETLATIEGAGVASLAIEVTDLNSPVSPGERIACKIRILKRGTDAASQVKATIEIPRNMQLESAKGPVEYTQESDKLTFHPIARLEPQKQAVIELTLIARKPADARLQVVVQSEQMAQPLRREEEMVVVPAQE